MVDIVELFKQGEGVKFQTIHYFRRENSGLKLYSPLRNGTVVYGFMETMLIIICLIVLTCMW